MLESFIKSWTTGRVRFIRRQDDNWVDRLNSRATVLLLLGFTALVFLTQWIRNPMSCWLPKNFDIIHREYIHMACWVSPFYYLPYTKEIPAVHEHDKRDLILYYQWIPWILLTQAFFFWFPCGVWHWLSEKSGLNTDVILDMASVLNNTMKLDKKEVRLRLLGEYIDHFLVGKSGQVESGHGCGCGRGCNCCCKASSLTLSYIFTKLLYVGNLFLQVGALAALLSTDYQRHIVSYISYYTSSNSTEDGQVWNSPVFPRIAFCDYLIRSLGNNRRYTAQCVMPVNMYLERMYLFLWLWIALLFIITNLDLLVWFWRYISRRDRLQFIRNQLYQGRRIAQGGSKDETAMFVDDYLRQDGTFVLRLVAHNTSGITAADVTGKLWDIWRERQDIEETIQTQYTVLNEDKNKYV